MENNTPQQPRVVRKIRKIKRPKTTTPPIAQPAAPLKAGVTQPQVQPEQSKPQTSIPPKINFGVSSQPQTRTLPQKEVFKQDTLYSKNKGIENIRFVSEEQVDTTQTNNIAELLKNKTILLLMGLSAIFGLFVGASSFSGSERRSRCV